MASHDVMSREPEESAPTAPGAFRFHPLRGRSTPCSSAPSTDIWITCCDRTNSPSSTTCHGQSSNWGPEWAPTCVTSAPAPG